MADHLAHAHCKSGRDSDRVVTLGPGGVSSLRFSLCVPEKAFVSSSTTDPSSVCLDKPPNGLCALFSGLFTSVYRS